MEIIFEECCKQFLQKKGLSAHIPWKFVRCLNLSFFYVTTVHLKQNLNCDKNPKSFNNCESKDNPSENMTTLASVSLSQMLNDILTLDQQWPLNRSNFPPISWPWYRPWPWPNYELFPWSIFNGCGIPAWNAYPSGHLVPSPFCGLDCAQIVDTRFLELAVSLLDFSGYLLDFALISICTWCIRIK